MTTPTPFASARGGRVDGVLSGRNGARLPVLFLGAFAGVLIALGVGIGALTGWIGATAYAVVVLAALTVGLSRRPAADAAEHQGCDCCAAAAAAPAPAGSIKL
jgi:hypothetical protein